MTHQTKLKCTNCSLHYVVLSWEDGWVEKNGAGFCPECGIKGAKIAWTDTTEQQIFEIVPGASAMTGMFPTGASNSFASGGDTVDRSPEAEALRTLGDIRRQEAGGA